jgi:hypothetical protein
LHVFAGTEYAFEIKKLWPPVNDITDDASIVSSPQLETAEMVTVYRAFPLEQFVTLLKIPMLSPPAIAVDVLTVGGEMMAQPVEPPPPPPPPGLLRCAHNGRASNTIQTNTNMGLVKCFFIGPPRLIELS